jgi:hypothetical protein
LIHQLGNIEWLNFRGLSRAGRDVPGFVRIIAPDHMFMTDTCTMPAQDRASAVPTQHPSSGTTIFQIGQTKSLQTLGKLAIPGRLELPTYGLGMRCYVPLTQEPAE